MNETNCIHAPVYCQTLKKEHLYKIVDVILKYSCVAFFNTQRRKSHSEAGHLIILTDFNSWYFVLTMHEHVWFFHRQAA